MAALTIFFIVYFLILVVFLAGWKRAVQPAPEAHTPKGRPGLISVVIPVRNEAHTILHLLEDLSRQGYRRFEVVAVDDHSTDETLWVLEHFPMENLRVVRNAGEGKKSAIATGVKHSRGRIIVTTDADCSVPPSWLQSFDNAFRHPTLMMAFGGVRMSGPERFFDALQTLEFSSLVGTSAATAALGAPTMCNGANLAFRKKVFNEVGGYTGNAHIASGDDEFLMRKVHERHRDGVRFINTPEALVTTTTQPNVRSFFHQRLRWASKWRYNTSLFSKALAVAVVLFQLAFIANGVLLFTPWILQALFFITLKMILEAAFLLQVSHFLRLRWNWLAFLVLQVVYPGYVVAVAAASFIVPYAWKDRFFKPKGLDFGRSSGTF